MIRHIRQISHRLGRDESGATIIEFAIVAPVMGLLLVGAFDIAHTLYTRAVLQGIVQKTSRDSTLETGLEANQQAALDNRVKAQASALANNGTVTITRKFYRTFSAAAIAQYEPFTDTNGDKLCNRNEPYEDTNNNSRWDNSGNSGQGSAKDAVLYTVTVSYPRFFPLYRFIGGSSTNTITATTVLRNQPYGDQAVPTVRNCPWSG